MYKVARITFTPLTADANAAIDKVDTVLHMLYMNGQITGEWIIEKHSSKYIANVVTTDDDSLDSKYYNSYIQKEIQDIDIKTEIICDDAMASDSCHCREHSHLILVVNPGTAMSPILCGDCKKQIPLIRIPYLFGEEEHYSILNFQEIYNSVDNLWMNSLSDRFTKRQITDHSSALNKIGIDICVELEQKNNTPCYYLLGNPIGGWFEFEKNNKILDACPKCGGSLDRLHNSAVYKACHKCRLAFITHKHTETEQ